MSAEFCQEVGKFIHQCGALEFLVNNSIKAFSTDKLLAIDAVNQPLAKRIQLLRKLLKERSKIDGKEVDSICKELNELGQARNIVAHNPIVADSPENDASCKILAIRHKAEGKVDIPNELSKKDIQALVARSGRAMLALSTLVPESTKT